MDLTEYSNDFQKNNFFLQGLWSVTNPMIFHHKESNFLGKRLKAGELSNSAL